MKRLTLLGSTGSIGTQTLEIVAAFPDKFKVVGLSAGRNIQLLAEQIAQFHPEQVCLANHEDIPKLRALITGKPPQICHGSEGLNEMVARQDLDMLIMAIVGTSGLKPTYNAIKNGIPIALACKEVLVSAGHLMMPLAKEKNVPIIPIDSEHAALKQCLAGIDEDARQVNKLILTASGGPFRTLSAAKLATVTIDDALAHPNWSMGAKISVDSSTLMNKGLEVIEAHYLFGIEYSNIEVVVHPESIIHSMVEYSDGSVVAQLGLPDMRFPIQYAITYPDKWENEWPKLNLAQFGTLNFEAPRIDDFPLLKLAFDAGRHSLAGTAVMNAANEQAVNLFLQNKINWQDISTIVHTEVENFGAESVSTIDAVIALDRAVKETVHQRYGTSISSPS